MAQAGAQDPIGTASRRKGAVTMANTEAGTGVGVLDKVMAVLDVLEAHRRAHPRTVAEKLGMSTPTAYRLMKAMASHGLLAGHANGEYELGLRLLHLGQIVSFRLDLVQVARPHLVELRDATMESVELHILSGVKHVPIHLEPGTRSVRTTSQVGIPLPLHKGASSRPLLIDLSESEALSLARRSAESDGELDAFDEATYLTRWRTVRERGYDFGVGERDPETGAAAAAVRGPGGAVIAQIVVSGTAQRFRDADHADLVLDRLRTAAAALTRDLAGDPVRTV